MKIDSKPGNFSFEQGLLIFVLLLLSAAAIYKAFTYEPLAAPVAARSAVPPPLKDPAGVKDVADGLKGTPEIKSREHKLFVPRLIAFKPSDGSIDVVEWDVPDKVDGITPRWKKDNDLDLGSASVASEDPDGDGYSNKEEFDAKTDPNDKNSSPPVIKKLFVKSYNPVQLQIIFKGYNETEPGNAVYEYQINTPTLSRRSWRLKEGEIIKVDEFNRYVIGKFRAKIVDEVNSKTGISEKVDKSELDVLDPRLNETITLLYNKTQQSDQSTVGFELLVPGESPDPAEVAIGQKFKVRGTEYQLRRVEDGNAVILDESSNKELVIPKAGSQAPMGSAPAASGAATPPDRPVP